MNLDPSGEIGQMMNQLIYPFVFILAVLSVTIIGGALLYYRFLRIIPEFLMKIACLLWAIFIVVQCTMTGHIEWINAFVSRVSIFGILGGLFVFMVIIAILSGVGSKSRGTPRLRRRKAPSLIKSVPATQNRSSMSCRSDEKILTCSLQELTGTEFERLLALYFRDQGYTVKEVGIGGNDGGVDLVITDKRGEKTAVQAKCYADHNKVNVQTVRELVAAKRNHDCILSLLITTSDLTEPAKKEAEQFKVDYWHGSLVEQKFRSWGKWQPGNRRTKVKSEIHEVMSQAASGATSTMKYKCGSDMVLRKNREGKSFWGCSSYPQCRHTVSY